MNARRIVMFTSLVVLTGLAAVAIWLRVATHAGPELHRIELRDGEHIEGLLFPLNEPVYVVQTESRSLITNADDIRKIDGNPVSRQGLSVSGDVVIVHETFEEILPTGEIDVRSSMRYRNSGSAIVHELRWGMAAHELKYTDSYRVLDVFGNSMPLQVVGDQDHGGKWVKVDLVRPLLPGEETWYTHWLREPPSPLREGEVWTYRHVGDYPESRLVTRSVLLPGGAEILAVTPKPLHQLQVDDRWLVVWRRFFFRGDTIPWEIRFRP
ncbi:MAG: hypothetical protein OEN01_02185 [Candidatus Krumholzibacteria bacterium]|nr:hypothetical protein [Candidatus Krumholzibacteria bacterium]